MDHALATGERQPTTEGDASQDEKKVLVISVADSGPGIPAGQENKLFGKFMMLSSQSSQKKVGQPTGSGLGLNLCLKFVQLMHGNIWVTNNPTGGSTFSFYIPMVSEKPIVAPSNEKAQPQMQDMSLTPEHRATFSKHRVLFVDDTLINRKVFTRMLQRIGISQQQTVGSGPEALDALKTNEFDLVLTDVQMPGMSGTELCEAIHSSDWLRQKPVVIGLTADTSQAVEDNCIDSGMADVLHKPITVNEMRVYFETVVGPLLEKKLQS